MVRFCFLEMAEKLHHEVSPTLLPTQDLNKNDTNKHANMEGGKSHGASTLEQELQMTKEG